MIAVTRFGVTDGILLAVVLVLIGASAVLALAETGLTRTTRAKAKSLVDSKHRGARALERLVENPDGFLAPVLLLVLLCQLVAATLVGVVAAHLFGAWGVAAATVFEVVVIFVFGEAVPKQWAVRHADRAGLLAAPMVTAVIAFPPVKWIARLLIGIARVITPGGDSEENSSDVTESELLAFADVALEDEAIEVDERALIHQIIEFGDTIVREVMVPRPDVIAVEGDLSVSAVLERAIAVGFSRIPVYHETIDDIVGIAFTKDLVRSVQRSRSGSNLAEQGAFSEGAVGDGTVREVARPAHYVPETKRVAPLLREMQRQQFHLAVVIDEYGGTAGIVTLEDLIEELVGEIVDEFDVNEPLIELVAPGAFRVSAKMPVDEVNELLTADLPLDDAWDTVGGLVLAKLGHVPVAGEVVDLSPCILTVDRVVGHRVALVKIERAGDEPLSYAAEVGEAAGAPIAKLP